MHDWNPPYIFSSAFFSDPITCIHMEFMDKGSLDRTHNQIGPIDISIVGKAALATLEG